MENYKRYGKAWRLEASNLSKNQLLDLFQKTTEHLNIVPTGTIEDFDKHALGILNDFDAGIASKEDAHRAFYDYTMKLMDTFYENAKKKGVFGEAMPASTPPTHENDILVARKGYEYWAIANYDFGMPDLNTEPSFLHSEEGFELEDVLYWCELPPIPTDV